MYNLYANNCVLPPWKHGVDCTALVAAQYVYIKSAVSDVSHFICTAGQHSTHTELPLWGASCPVTAVCAHSADIQSSQACSNQFRSVCSLQQLHIQKAQTNLWSPQNLPKCDFQVQRVNVSGKRKPAASRKSFATCTKANIGHQKFRNTCSDEVKAGLELKSQILHLSSLLTWFTTIIFDNEFERMCFHIMEIWEASCSSAS